MRNGLRVGLVQTTVSWTKSNINLSYLIAIDRRDVEVYANAIHYNHKIIENNILNNALRIIKFSVFGCSVFHT